MPETLATRAGKCTPKERKFAHELVKTGNQRQSALNAYNTDKVGTADQLAYQNLKKTRVREEIARVTASVDLAEINDDTWRAAIVEKAFQGSTDNVRLKGIELGAKVYGLLDERPIMQQNIQLNTVSAQADTRELAQGLTARLKLAGKVIDTRQVTNSPSGS